ncbi:MAG: AAA family ATPase [Chloroflexi bacterium]|nr:AAA family ATPase [Chloroflexota bacterium]
MAASVLPDLVEALLHPEAYPERPARVDLLQTHVSYLFLTPDHVYKVKKPVDFGFLDFTTLERRRVFCFQEVELNRRLSPDVYLGVVEVRRDAAGRFSIEGPGETVEYAVKMVRLPEDRVMSRLLVEHQVGPERVTELAQLVARFHREAATSPEISRYGSLETLRFNADENFQQTAPYLGRTISQQQYDAIRAYTDRFLTTQQPLLERRVATGRIRDCHGDLHLGQIFCTDRGIKVIDCIEFNERFRYSDVAADIAFTAMDLDSYGRHDLSQTLVAAYVAASGDQEIPALLDYYKLYRAYVRGKVEGFRLDDPHVPAAEREAARRRAAGYFSLAYRYTQRGRPVLIVVCGLVGTGKTTVAQALADTLGAAVESSDVVRKRLAGIPATERHLDPFGQGLYAPEMTRRTYDELFRLARQWLEEGYAVVLDASFHRAADRQRALALALEVGAAFWLVECTAPAEVVRGRLEQRVSTGDGPSDGRWEIYEAQRRTFEPITELPAERHVVLDTARQTAADVAEALTSKVTQG